MNEARTQSSIVGRRGRGLVVVVAGGLVILGLVSIVKPPPRSATAGPNGLNAAELRAGPRQAFKEPVDPSASAPRNAEQIKRLKTLQNAGKLHPKGWKLLGSLEGREHIVKCWATPDGPRYSVYALDGRLIQDELPADEVYRGFPDVDLTNLRADPPEGGPLMSADSGKD
jgi:hypothetical protein